MYIQRNIFARSRNNYCSWNAKIYYIVKLYVTVNWTHILANVVHEQTDGKFHSPAVIRRKQVVV